MTNFEACLAVAEHRGQAVVVTTQSAALPRIGWPAVSNREELDFPLWTAMGKASSIGLGLALARPDKKVIILDGDSSLLMNLGSLATISERAPANLYHFVFENGIYAGTGGQPIPGNGKLDFKEIAIGAGYSAAYEFDDLQELAINLRQVLEGRGPVFVVLKIAHELDSTPNKLRERPNRTMLDAVVELRDALALQAGN